MCILTIYLDKLELGLDIYVYVYVCRYVFTSRRLVHCGATGLFYSGTLPYFISNFANTVFFFCSFDLGGKLYSGSLYRALDMEYSIPGCRRVVHGELSLARLEH